MDIKELKNKSLEDLAKIETLADLEQFRIKYLSRKGEVSNLLRSLKDMPIEQRKNIGPEANQLRQDLEQEISRVQNHISKSEQKKETIDITAPGIKAPHGHLHPITLALRKIEEIFQSMGFKTIEGFEVETEHYSFDALNMPYNHPARDTFNTFWLKTKPEKLVLRPHTSPMQIRFMEKNNPPLRIIVPGRVFRYEATDASHSHTFYQLEGLMVDRHISIANFKAVVEQFLKKFFNENVETRIRPSYYPFVEPGFDIEMKFPASPAGGPSGKWMEVMGAGMVHPNVFKSAGYVPGEWQGFAFGGGVDRLVMLKYKINDIRLLYANDLRFLNQF